MDIPVILDRISRQINSFQDSFRTLSRVKSLEEMGKKFCGILKENILSDNVNIFHKEKDNQSWKSVCVSKPESVECINNFHDNHAYQITFLMEQEFKVCILLPLVDNTSFGILLGPKRDNSDYSDVDKITLQIFLQLLDNAYQSFISQQKEKNLLFSLNHKILQLNSLIDTGIAISKFDQKNIIFNLALERAISLTNASRGVFQVTEKGEIREIIYFPAKFSFKNEHNAIQTGFLYNNLTYSFILIDKETRNGFVSFDETDKLLLAALARQVHAALENQRLHLEALEKQKLDQELSVAGSIQRAILPNPIPLIKGYDLYGINIPSKEIGGDFFDCIQLKDGRIALIMADVSGKGISAALLVSSLHASLHAYLDNSLSLVELVQNLNKVIYKSTTIDKYVTLFIALLDAESGQLETVNAGHNTCFVLRADSQLIELKKGGIPLGLMNTDFPYKSENLILQKGDRLFLYTDGIPEAMNTKGKFYEDTGRFKEIMLDGYKAAKDFIQQLVSDVNDFRGDAEQSDDITALYLVKQQ